MGLIPPSRIRPAGCPEPQKLKTFLNRFAEPEPVTNLTLGPEKNSIIRLQQGNINDERNVFSQAFSHRIFSPI